MKKHSSLLHFKMKHGRKKFYGTYHGWHGYKTFFFITDTGENKLERFMIGNFI